MRDQIGVRGDYFIDRLGGWFEVLLAFVSLGIVLARFRLGFSAGNVVLAALYGVEIVGAILITRSRFSLMKIAYALFLIRVLAGIAYSGVIHPDKLAERTLGFPILIVVYCFFRVRALRSRP